MAPPDDVLTVVLVFLAFASSHSLCVTERAKRMFADIAGLKAARAFYRFIFTLMSMATAGMAVYLVSGIPDRTVVELSGWWKWVFNLLRTAGVITGVLAFRVIDGLEFLGIRQVVDFLAGRQHGGDIEGISGDGFLSHGIYSRVRHPLYLAGILIVTFNPHVTRNGLVLTVLADMYFIAGTFLEEKRMTARYGQPYTEYLRRVPRLIPSLSRRQNLPDRN